MKIWNVLAIAGVSIMSMGICVLAAASEPVTIEKDAPPAAAVQPVAPLPAAGKPVAGILFAAGNCAKGQLGLGVSGEEVDRNSFTQAAADVLCAAGGGEFSLMVKTPGTVWGAGDNSKGQLGTGNTTDCIKFTQAAGLTGVFTAVSAGEYHSLALKDDGTIWAAGDNSYGQLGVAGGDARNTFAQATGLTGKFIAISAGKYHSLALKEDGTLWACGYNADGELGMGDTFDRGEFTQVGGLSGVTAIAAGGQHSLVVKNDGTVWATGQNANGQLGTGNYRSQPAFVQVAAIKGKAIAVAAGDTHSLVLMDDGAVWSAGGNYYGQLGLGDTNDRVSFTLVPGLAAVSSIAAGGSHSLALKRDRTIWAAGSSFSGQLGMGNYDDQTRFAKVASPAGIAAIAAGYDFSFAIRAVLPPATTTTLPRGVTTTTTTLKAAAPQTP